MPAAKDTALDRVLALCRDADERARVSRIALDHALAPDAPEWVILLLWSEGVTRCEQLVQRAEEAVAAFPVLVGRAGEVIVDEVRTAATEPFKLLRDEFAELAAALREHLGGPRPRALALRAARMPGGGRIPTDASLRRNAIAASIVLALALFAFGYAIYTAAKVADGRSQVAALHDGRDMERFRERVWCATLPARLRASVAHETARMMPELRIDCEYHGGAK